MRDKIKTILVKHFDGSHAAYEGCIDDVVAMFILEQIKSVEKQTDTIINADFKLKNRKNG